MTEEESVLDGDLDRIVASSDPMTLIFELNEEMMWRVGRIGYVLSYAFWVGIFMAVLAVVFIAWTIFTEILITNLVLAAIVILASVTAIVFARHERPFLDEYKVLAGAVSRARNWQPNPVIPEGADVVDRYLKYLASQDERFAYYYEKKPKYLHKDFRMRSKAGKEIHFDAVLTGSSYPWDPVIEDICIIIRVVPVATPAEVKSMKDDAEYMLKHRGVRFAAKPGPARIVLIQSGRSDFDKAAVEEANTNWVRYTRTLGGDDIEWSSPIELVAESDAGTYSFGTVSFG